MTTPGTYTLQAGDSLTVTAATATTTDSPAVPAGAAAGQTGVVSRSGAVIPASVEVLGDYDWAAGQYAARPDVPRVTWIGPRVPLIAPSGPAEPGDYWIADDTAVTNNSAIRSESYGACTDKTTWHVTLPADVRAGDELTVILATGYAEGGITWTTPLPDGFTLRTSQALYSNVEVFLLTKVADGTEGGTTVDFPAQRPQTAAFYCAALDGVADAPLISAATFTATTTSIAAPALTVPAGSVVLTAAFIDYGSAATWVTTLPDGATERALIASGRAADLTVQGKIVQLAHAADGPTDPVTWAWTTKFRGVLLTTAFTPATA